MINSQAYEFGRERAFAGTFYFPAWRQSHNITLTVHLPLQSISCVQLQDVLLGKQPMQPCIRLPMIKQTPFQCITGHYAITHA